MTAVTGDVTATECQMINRFAGSATQPPQVMRGQGSTFGYAERKAAGDGAGRTPIEYVRRTYHLEPYAPPRRQTFGVNRMNMNASLQIREATGADLPAVLGLYAQPDLDDGSVLPPAQAQQIFRRFRRYPDYKLYVAIDEDEIVGSLALLIMDNLGHQGAPFRTRPVRFVE